MSQFFEDKTTEAQEDTPRPNECRPRHEEVVNQEIRHHTAWQCQRLTNTEIDKFYSTIHDIYVSFVNIFNQIKLICNRHTGATEKGVRAAPQRCQPKDQCILEVQIWNIMVYLEVSLHHNHIHGEKKSW